MDVSGYKWGDVDGSGTWNESDGAALGGWTIVLDRDNIIGNNNEISVTITADGTTDADGDGDIDAADKGYYAFNNIGPVTDDDGVLWVYEIQQDGFTQTYGNGGFSFSITSGLVIEGSLGETEEGNFGNQMLAGANRTPGFWQSTLGKSLYDGNNANNGDANGDGKPDGDKDFAAEGWSTTDLLTKYGVDKLGANGQPGSDGKNDTFIVWDADRDGNFDPGQDIFLTAMQLAKWVGSTGDNLKMLERDIGATFLNTLNNHSLTTPEQGTGDKFTGMDALDPDIADAFEDAVAFALKFDADLNGISSGSKKVMQFDWNNGGSAAHNELAAFNESGEAMTGATLKQVVMDGDDYSSSFVQNYLAMASSEQQGEQIYAVEQLVVI
jgi:hypothetical protein